MYDGDLPVTVFGDHTRRLKYIDFSFAVGADGTQLLIPRENIDRNFFYYALKGAYLKNYGYQRHFKYLKDTKISLPDLLTQKQIAGILSAYDELIENNTKRIKILEEIAQTIYKEWFIKFNFPVELVKSEKLKVKSKKNVGYKKAGGKMINSKTEFGKIPEGWEVKKIKNES